MKKSNLIFFVVGVGVEEGWGSAAELGTVGRVPDSLIVDLLFYVHGKHIRSRRDGQLT